MTPEECRYFANTNGPLNPAFYFRWADFNNVYMNDWDKVATHFLSIPMAHQFIGDYTIADAKDEQLKVLRSYQYYAVNKIADTVAKNRLDGRQISAAAIFGIPPARAKRYPALNRRS